jgi:hypothetical protein
MSAFEYRVTKYNPIYRNEQGHFLRNEWTFFAEIGESFDNVTLTLEEYERVEAVYAQTAMAFLRESGKLFKVERLQNNRNYPNPFRQGDTLGKDKLEQAFRDVLRERYWCSFGDADCFVHFGWDFYMYIGVPMICEKAIDFAHSAGLFVEPFQSPYK